MKNKIVSLLAIIFGIMIISLPTVGVISTSAIIGLSVLFIAIYALIMGISIIDYNTYGSITDLALGVILLIISIGLIFNPALFGFLAEITLYLAGIILIIAGVVSLINNRSSKYGFYCKPDYFRFINRNLVSNKWNNEIIKLISSFFGVYLDMYKCRF